MPDTHPHRAHDLEFMLRHRVVDGGDGPHGGVLDRQHAVVAHPRLDGAAHVLESAEVEDRGEGEEAARGLLRVGALRAGTRHGGGRRKLVGRLLERLADLRHERVLALDGRALAPARDGEERREEESRLVLHVGPHLLRDACEDLAFARGVENRRALRALRLGHLGGDREAAHEEFAHVLVDLVDFLANVFQVFHGSALFRVRFSRRPCRRRGGSPRCGASCRQTSRASGSARRRTAHATGRCAPRR